MLPPRRIQKPGNAAGHFVTLETTPPNRSKTFVIGDQCGGRIGNSSEIFEQILGYRSREWVNRQLNWGDFVMKSHNEEKIGGRIFAGPTPRQTSSWLSPMS